MSSHVPLTCCHVDRCSCTVFRPLYFPRTGLPGDGVCNESNNIPECKYDGGDCCSCTCVPQPRTDDYFYYTTGDDYHGCESFSCIDPDAPCVSDDDITVDLLETCDTVSMSDARCDEHNNTPECSECGRVVS